MDGEGVQVVGQDRPAGPGPLPLVALQPAAPQPVAALEVADAPFGAGAVAGQPLASAPGAGLGTPGDERPPWCQRGRGLGGRARHKPPSTATSRGVRSSRSSSAAVCSSRRSSPGLPGALAAGSTYPRAPRRVLAVTSATWTT